MGKSAERAMIVAAESSLGGRLTRRGAQSMYTQRQFKKLRLQERKQMSSDLIVPHSHTCRRWRWPLHIALFYCEFINNSKQNIGEDLLCMEPPNSYPRISTPAKLLNPTNNSHPLESGVQSEHFVALSGKSSNPQEVPSTYIQYQLQHNKWGDIRSRIKAMKLDNYTVRTYKSASNTESRRGLETALSMILENPNAAHGNSNNLVRNSQNFDSSLPVYRPNNSAAATQGANKVMLQRSNAVKNYTRKIRESTRHQSASKQIMLSYTQSAKNKLFHSNKRNKTATHNQEINGDIGENSGKEKEEDRRDGYLSNTGQYRHYRTGKEKQYSNTAKGRRPQPNHLAEKDHLNNQSLSKNTPERDNPEDLFFENLHGLPQSHSFRVIPTNKDLQVLNKISQEHIDRRLIIRRKSEILNSNSSILAWEASIVNQRSLLFLCDENKYASELVDFSGYNDQSWEGTVSMGGLAQTKRISTSQYRLLMGPYEINRHRAQLRIDDLSMLASVLLDHLCIDSEHEKLKIKKDEMTAMMGCGQLKSEVMKGIQKNPFIRLIGNRKRSKGKKDNSPCNLLEYPHKNRKYAPYLLNQRSRPDNQAGHQPQEFSSSSSEISSNKDDLFDNHQTKTVHNNTLEDPKDCSHNNSQQVSEHLSFIQASKNISEDIVGEMPAAEEATFKAEEIQQASQITESQLIEEKLPLHNQQPPQSGIEERPRSEQQEEVIVAVNL